MGLYHGVWVWWLQKWVCSKVFQFGCSDGGVKEANLTVSGVEVANLALGGDDESDLALGGKGGGGGD